VSAVPDEPDTALLNAMKKAVDRGIVRVNVCEPGDPEPYYVAPSTPLIAMGGFNRHDLDRLTASAADTLMALPELVQLRKEAEIGRRVLALELMTFRQGVCWPDGSFNSNALLVVRRLRDGAQ
jgi:hypothetical protein